MLVSFDAVNMFPNIDNRSGLESVKFNDQNFLQTDGTAQGPHMSCSYADIAMAKYDFLANQSISNLKPEKDSGIIFLLHGNMVLIHFLLS